MVRRRGSQVARASACVVRQLVMNEDSRRFWDGDAVTTEKEKDAMTDAGHQGKQGWA